MLILSLPQSNRTTHPTSSRLSMNPSSTSSFGENSSTHDITTTCNSTKLVREIASLPIAPSLLDLLKVNGFRCCSSLTTYTSTFIISRMYFPLIILLLILLLLILLPLHTMNTDILMIWKACSLFNWLVS